MVAFSMSNMFHGRNRTHFADIFQHLESLHPTKHSLMPHLLTIVHLILINSGTSFAPDRSLSVAQRIKTWLCSTMTTKWFNNLSILSINKELTGSINLVDIGSEFASKYDGYRMNLGKSVPSDLLWLF